MVLNSAAKKWLRHCFGRNVKFDELMSKHTSLRVGGPAGAYVTPETSEDLIKLVGWSWKNKLPYLVIGDGSNLLVKDNGIDGIVIKLKKCLNSIFQDSGEKGDVAVTAMAGVRMHALCRFAITSGLGGMNFALGIPGTVGGGIMMNAGTSYGWVADVLDAITVLHASGRTRRIGREKLNFSYRSLSWENKENRDDHGQSIILDGCFILKPSDPQMLKNEADAILDKRRNSQPVDSHSAGCFFKNPASGKSAGELIELAGLKGTSIGGAEVSPKHANFIINRGKATASDCLDLMEHVQEIVAKKFNIILEAEVKIVGS
jgi:UDP-N-acetylmuramate dehydrogenase